MLHHVNKNGDQRGISSREDNIDTSIMLKAPHDYMPEDGARFICRFGKARVSTKDLNLISDTEFKLTSDESAKYAWAYGSVKKEQRIEVLRLLDEGLIQKDVAESLGISKGQVSKIRNKAVKEGYLSAKNKLTQSGFLEVSNG